MEICTVYVVTFQQLNILTNSSISVVSNLCVDISFSYWKYFWVDCKEVLENVA